MEEKGWLKKILEEVKEDVDKWPAWMRSKPIVNLKSILDEEEIWAYHNQTDAIKNDLLLEVAWNRGYRNALRTIANRMDIKLNIAG